MSLNPKSILKLLPELIVIFVGVYCAFLLESFKNEKNELNHQKDYFESFLIEVNQIHWRTKNLKQEIDSVIHLAETNVDFDHYYHPDFDYNQNLFLIQSAFINTNFSTIGPRFLTSLEGGGNLMKSIEKRLDALQHESRKFMIYGNSENTKFKSWYIEELNAISNMLGTLLQEIEQGALPATKQIIEELKE